MWQQEVSFKHANFCYESLGVQCGELPCIHHLHNDYSVISLSTAVVVSSMILLEVNMHTDSLAAYMHSIFCCSHGDDGHMAAEG